MTMRRLPYRRHSGTPRMMESARNVIVWYGFPVTVRDGNGNRPERDTRLGIMRSGLPKHPRTPVSSPRVNAGHAADRALTQRTGDMRRGHEAFKPATCTYTGGRCPR